MTVTIDSFTTNSLLVQPYGYDGNAQDGLTARKWSINGLLTATQWQTLRTVYNDWRDTRITDADTWSSASTGTTVSLTVNANGITATSIPCWFLSAPTGDQVGRYIDAKVDLIDAAQSLAVLLRGKEKSRQASEADRPSFGTYSFDYPAVGAVSAGTAVLTLTKNPDGYRDGPQLQITAGGSHRISGPLIGTRIKDLEGITDATGWYGVRTWYEDIVTSSPSVASWYPTSEPTATAERIISGGAVTTRYIVRITLAQVR